MNLKENTLSIAAGIAVSAAAILGSETVIELAANTKNSLEGFAIGAVFYGSAVGAGFGIASGINHEKIKFKPLAAGLLIGAAAILTHQYNLASSSPNPTAIEIQNTPALEQDVSAITAPLEKVVTDHELTLI